MFDILTTQELATFLGVCPETLWKWQKRGLIPQPTRGISGNEHVVADVLAAIRKHRLRVSPEALELTLKSESKQHPLGRDFCSEVVADLRRSKNQKTTKRQRTK